MNDSNRPILVIYRDAEHSRPMAVRRYATVTNAVSAMRRTMGGAVTRASMFDCITADHVHLADAETLGGRFHWAEVTPAGKSRGVGGGR